MKFDYINKLPVELAVNAYIDQKVWKSGDKDIAEQKQFSIKEYLVQKMSVFVDAYSVEQRESVRHFFLRKIEGIKLGNIQPVVYSQADCEDLENRIGEKIKNSFSDLTHEETSFKEKNGKRWRVEAWGLKLLNKIYINLDKSIHFV